MLDSQNRAFYLNDILTIMEEYVYTLIDFNKNISISRRIECNNYPKTALINARALYYFFYATNEHIKKDDINSFIDYGYRPLELFSNNEEAIKRISKGIVHLTRISNWNYPWGRDVGLKLEAQLFPEIQGFLNHILADDVLLEYIKIYQFNQLFNYDKRTEKILSTIPKYLIIKID